jgi:hypothetical protein
MDGAMAALATGAALLAIRGARRERLGPVLGAGVLAGLAFDVKLAESLLPAAAVLVLWLLAAPRGLRGRGALLGAGAFAVTALAWLVAVSIVPLHPRPWALGSSNGSPWDAALVYDGVHRLVPRHSGATPRAAAAAGGHAGASSAAVARHARDHAQALRRRPGPPSVMRLASGRAHLNTWIGIEAVAALAALAAALALARPWRLDGAARGGLAGLAFWFAGGLVLCSLMPDLRPRYLACVEPAVAGVLGAGIALAARGRGRAAAGTAAAVLLAVLAVPLAVSAGAVAHHTQDSGRPGALAEARVAPLSSYLRARDAGAADELAVSAPAKAGQLIARDGRPVLVLSDGAGRQLVSPARLAAAVAAHRVRFALLGDACTAASGNARTGCLPVVRWAHRHGVDVSRAAGQPRPGVLFALRTSVVAAAGSGRTPRSATSSRTRRAAARSAGRRATRGPGGRGARARRPSRRRSGAR